MAQSRSSNQNAIAAKSAAPAPMQTAVHGGFQGAFQSVVQEGVESAKASSEVTRLRNQLGNRAFNRVLHRAVKFASAAQEREADWIADRSLRNSSERIIEQLGGARPPALPADYATDLPELDALLQTQGVALDVSLRNFFESRLGVNLDHVRVHTDAIAQRAVNAVGARAFAFGEHLAFSAHEYAPHTRRGRDLLAHELAHLCQQAHTQQLFLGKQNWRDPRMPGETVTEITPGLIQRQGPGYITIETIEITWARIEWDPGTGHAPTVQVVTSVTEPSGADSYGREAIGLRIVGGSELAIALNRRNIEIPSSNSWRLFSYDFQAHGTLHVDDVLTPLPYRHRELYPPHPYGEEQPPIELNPPTAAQLDPLTDAPTPHSAPDQRQAEDAHAREQDMIRGQPAFDTRAAMEDYVRAHPDQSFIGIETTLGRFVARAVSEDDMVGVASEYRNDADSLPEVAWDVGARRSAWRVTGVYQHGHAIDVGSLHDLYYGSEIGALDGASDDPEECEVFRMGRHSFGRKPLTHEQAVARWSEFDGRSPSQMRSLETEPGHAFISLRVRGAGRLDDIDQSYFHGREEFRSRAAALTTTNWVDVYQTLFDGSHSDISSFLLAETDRETQNPAFTAMLRGNGGLAEAVSQFMYDQIEYRAQQVALEAIAQARSQLAPLADDVDHMRSFVLGFADMSATGQEDAMRFIGVPENERPFTLSTLRDREAAWRVALGLEESHEEVTRMTVPDDLPSQTHITIRTTHRVSLDLLRDWAATTVTGLDQARTQLEADTSLALWMDGDLGIHVRRQVYHEFGFHLLRPESFPHREETEGWWPDPMDAGPIAFTSLAEQMYANKVRSQAATNTALKVLTITAMVIVTIVLVLVAQELGAMIAGIWLAEGSAAYVATELIVSGVAFTAMSELRTRLMEGHWESDSVGDFVGHSLLNIATFGAFRYLNVLLAAGATRFAAIGVERGFFAAERAGMVSTGLRIGMTGATFMAVGIAQRLASGQHFDSISDFALFAYENLLTIALLEAGSVAARPLMERGTIWAREARLGELEAPITELRGDLARLNRDLASLSMRPQAASRDAPELIERTRSLLERQRALAEQLRARFRTRSDASQLDAQAGQELQTIDAALAGIRQAEFLTDLHITPVGDSESVYTYQGGASAAERFRQFYGADRVTVAEDGTIRATVEGLESRDMVFVPAERYAPPVGGGAAPEIPELVRQQDALQARQRALLSRARLLGVTDPSLTAIRSLRPTQTTDPARLRTTEEAIARAERDAGARMNELTRNILQNVRTRLGRDAIDQIRAGELRGVSDADLADILWQVRGRQDMGVAQLRALVFAAQPGEPTISIPRLLRTISRGRFVVADRNFALETFTQMMELRVAGARQMLADMAASPGKFRGGLFQMEVIRFVGGAEAVAGIEIREPIAARAREYDITLRDGTRIECKDWSTWEYADGLGDQFLRDMAHLTDNFTNPSGMRRMRYLFRRVNGQPVRPVEEIKSFLRTRLERQLAGETEEVRNAMLREFDAYGDLVQSPELQRSGSLSLPPPGAPSPAPPFPHDDEDEDQGDAGVGGSDEGE